MDFVCGDVGRTIFIIMNGIVMLWGVWLYIILFFMHQRFLRHIAVRGCG